MNVSIKDCYPNLDSLPIEFFYFHLFNYLNLDEIFNLRLVNKKLHSVVKSYQADELCLKYDDFVHKTNWFSMTKSNRLRYMCDFSELTLSILSSNLKYLRISDLAFLPIKLEDVNKFTKLQVLEMEGISEQTQDQCLKLPELNALSIHDGYVSRLTIDAPVLQSLELPYLSGSLMFKNPQSVRYLKAKYFADWPIFINVECLEINDWANQNALDLMEFENLKKLKVNFDRFKKFKAEILRDLYELTDLEIVLNGVKINDVNKFDEYYMEHLSLKFQLDNYDDLEDDLNFVTNINYSDLISLLPKKQPSDFFIKYNNIQSIYIDSEINDENRLLQFIRECLNLNCLYIRESSIGQKFYDQLPEISSLSNLDIHESKNLNLNFEFLINMPNLIKLETNQQVLTNECLINKILKNFSFKINNEKFEIDMVYGRYFIEGHDFKKNNKKMHSNLSFSELVEWFNSLSRDSKAQRSKDTNKERFLVKIKRKVKHFIKLMNQV